MDIVPTGLRDGRRTFTFCLDDELIDTFGPKIGAYGIAVYALLARHAKEKQCFPSYKRMCEKLGLSRQTITRTLDLLSKHGLVIKDKRITTAGDHDTNLYTLCDLSYLHRHRGTSPQDLPTSADYPPTSQEDLPTSPQDVGVGNVGTEGTSPQDPEGISFKVSHLKEGIPSPPTGDLPAAKKSRGKQPTPAYSPGFQRFIEAYPKGRVTSKPTCYDKWTRAGLEGRTDELIEKIERLKITNWQDDYPRYVPYSLTWFNQKRWEDDLVPLPSPLAGRLNEKELRSANAALRVMERIRQEGRTDGHTGHASLLRSLK